MPPCKDARLGLPASLGEDGPPRQGRARGLQSPPGALGEGMGQHLGEAGGRRPWSILTHRTARVAPAHASTGHWACSAKLRVSTCRRRPALHEEPQPGWSSFLLGGSQTRCPSARPPSLGLTCAGTGSPSRPPAGSGLPGHTALPGRVSWGQGPCTRNAAPPGLWRKEEPRAEGGGTMGPQSLDSCSR